MKYTRVYREIERAVRAGKHYIVNIGGAGSSKTYSTMQYLLNQLVNNQKEPLKILVVRKTNNQIKYTNYTVAMDILSQMRTDVMYESDSIVCGKNLMRLTGLRTLRSKYYTETYDITYIEEATDMSNLDLGKILSHLCNILLVSCNPTFDKKNYWIKDICKVAEVIHSTHKDNPFMYKEFHTRLEELVKIDKRLYDIYSLGIEPTKQTVDI